MNSKFKQEEHTTQRESSSIFE
jgi:hypothetical protein